MIRIYFSKNRENYHAGAEFLAPLIDTYLMRKIWDEWRVEVALDSHTLKVEWSFRKSTDRLMSYQKEIDRSHCRIDSCADNKSFFQLIRYFKSIFFYYNPTLLIR